MSPTKKSTQKKAVKKSVAKKATARSKAQPAQPKVQKRKSHLGKGLGALIGNKSTTAKPKAHSNNTAAPIEQEAVLPVNAIIDVPVAEIERSPWQPRQTFDQEALLELAKSIKVNGVIQPIICRKNEKNRYELIAGERRLRASIEAQMKKIPVILVDAEDRRAAEMAIVENIQRQDLNVIEEAEGYRTLADLFNMTQQDVADRVGKARASVANAVRLLELPDEVKQLIGNGLLSSGHAKVLLSLSEPTEQIILSRKCVTDGMTVRNLENVIKRRKCEANAPEKRPGKPDLPQEYIRNLTDLLHKHFGTAVRLSSGMTHANGNHTKGVLEIDFYDNSDLDRVLEVLGVSLN
ncbi:MAG: ParB/RepB/Spo0J family partition protein [Kiritimatiellae bacterium]|jgi:ParB family chromosome partitioning protein|nr:ParB/RepB/Spo0J family partition protein [Kiritimatiellia bacterium]